MLRDVHPRAGTRPVRTTDAASAPRFIAGDPLRAIAALGVVVFHLIFALGLLHFPADPGAAHALARFSELPRLGLYVFFVLSGYLLGRPFVRAFVERRRHRTSRATCATVRCESRPV